MPDFLKRLVLLVAAAWIGVKVTLSSHQPLHALIALAVTFVAILAIMKWEFG